MKYIKTYEELTLRKSDELDDNFMSDIIDICSELDDVYPITVSFDKQEYRKGYFSGHMLEEDKPIYKSDYPSITITVDQPEKIYDKERRRYTEPRWLDDNQTYRGRARKVKSWNEECLLVANRMKNYLGDNFLLFTIIGSGDERSFKLNDNTTPSDLHCAPGIPCSFPRLDVSTHRQGDIRKFRIIYNPEDYLK